MLAEELYKNHRILWKHSNYEYECNDRYHRQLVNTQKMLNQAMIQVNSFLCHHVATKTEDNCDEIGHATFSDATFSDATFSDATFSDATFSYKSSFISASNFHLFVELWRGNEILSCQRVCV